MDSQHRYFKISQASDAELTHYRARLSLICRLQAFAANAYVTGTALLFPLWIAFMAGCALVTSHFSIGSMLLTTSLGFAVAYGSSLLAGSLTLAVWKRTIPVPGTASLVTPLGADSTELANIQKAAATYAPCGAYLRAVEEQGRKFYQFDANYIAELVAVLKRGEGTEAYTTLALRN